MTNSKRRKGTDYEKSNHKINKILVWLAVITIIIMIMMGAIVYIIPPPNAKEPLRINVDNIKIANDYMSCETKNTATLSFSLFYIAGEREEGSYPYYMLTESNNSCYNGTFFRNQTRNFLCWNDYSTGQRIRNCQSKFEPLWYEPTDVISYLNNETETFYTIINKNNITTRCEILEKIKLCAYNDHSCSEPKSIKLTYLPCDN